MAERREERRLPIVHALGTPGTRTIPKELGQFASSAQAWARRLRSGQAQSFMARDITRLDTQLALTLFGDWTDRIAAGEVPAPPPGLRAWSATW